MSTWDDIEKHLANVNQRYLGDERKDRNARDAIRKLVLDLERKAAERDTLRQMLVDQGVENARLDVELEQLRVQLEARSWVADEQPCAVCAEETLEGKDRAARSTT